MAISSGVPTPIRYRGRSAGRCCEGGFDDLAGDLPRLADAQPADRIAGKADLDGALGRFLAKIEIHPALHDAEKGSWEALSSKSFRRLQVSSLSSRLTPCLKLETTRDSQRCDCC